MKAKARSKRKARASLPPSESKAAKAKDNSAANKNLEAGKDILDLFCSCADPADFDTTTATDTMNALKKSCKDGCTGRGGCVHMGQRPTPVKGLSGGAAFSAQFAPSTCPCKDMSTKNRALASLCERCSATVSQILSLIKEYNKLMESGYSKDMSSFRPLIRDVESGLDERPPPFWMRIATLAGEAATRVRTEDGDLDTIFQGITKPELEKYLAKGRSPHSPIPDQAFTEAQVQVLLSVTRNSFHHTDSYESSLEKFRKALSAAPAQELEPFPEEIMKNLRILAAAAISGTTSEPEQVLVLGVQAGQATPHPTGCSRSVIMGKARIPVRKRGGVAGVVARPRPPK